MKRIAVIATDKNYKWLLSTLPKELPDFLKSKGYELINIPNVKVARPLVRNLYCYTCLLASDNTFTRDAQVFLNDNDIKQVEVKIFYTADLNKVIDNLNNL